ncbi:Agamous-like MADS-box protein AGL62 [Cardamine amara subsp. amara]|uniref:Agamous-like MADS-box protein AGL62 n=1 Tax=Cardamine amara subsp. amara TaxID=228776 RepID=A0ABD1AXW9_CARAN
MSMEQTKGRLTKGKQKIEMKVIESYGDRMVTFSKRKAGILKKMSEIITMCNVEAAFLVFSETRKPYTFAHPSMKELAERLNNYSRQEMPEKDHTVELIEAHKKQNIENFVKNFEALEEELATVNEKLKLLKKSRNEKKLNKMWWNSPLKNLSVEECQKRHQAFLELHDKLCDMAFSRLGKNGSGTSSGHARGGHSDGD